jgi:carbonic anhydrase/acetyltransferase-like protein (isoleucine patch superfamily)
MRRTLLTTAVATVMAVGALVPAAAAAEDDRRHGVPAGAGDGPPEAGSCSPTGADLPVCPADAPAGTASFLDPSAEVVGGRHVTLGEQVYVAPFASLVASAEAPISVGAESNIQDNVSVVAARELVEGPQDGAHAVGGGVEIADRVILAHGSSVIGPARIGVGGGDIPADPDGDQEVFLSFGSQVDGAVLERNTGVSALGRVGPGVTLRSGTLVLPGKNVTTQAEADDPALGKVRLVNEADVAFNEAVIEVNVAFAREYTELYREDPDALYGVNVDPGGTEFNPDRDLPDFAGEDLAVPGHRNRVIGEVDFADPFSHFDAVVGNDVSLRADEGEDFTVGHVEAMGNGVVFHALEDTDLVVGDDVTYGEGVIAHGGGRVVVAGQPEEPTVIHDGVTLEDEAVVFRSTIGEGATIGERSAVVGTDLAPGTVVPDRVIVLNGEEFGAVEW